jgi:hypothetical protein
LTGGVLQMKNELDRHLCPLCGMKANFLENEISSVDCQKCGKYTYHISVHPFLFEIEHRNSIVLKMLSDMAEIAAKNDDPFEIDLTLYQRLEKKLFS